MLLTGILLMMAGLAVAGPTLEDLLARTSRTKDRRRRAYRVTPPGTDR